MKKIRIGNDIPVVWRVYANGSPLSLEGADITLYLEARNTQDKVFISDYTIVGNAISFVFAGASQTQSGIYNVVCVVNDGQSDMRTFDVVGAFMLVAYSCMEDMTSNVTNPDIPSLYLQSDLSLGFSHNRYSINSLIEMFKADPTSMLGYRFEVSDSSYAGGVVYVVEGNPEQETTEKPTSPEETSEPTSPQTPTEAPTNPEPTSEPTSPEETSEPTSEPTAFSLRRTTTSTRNLYLVVEYTKMTDELHWAFSKEITLLYYTTVPYIEGATTTLSEMIQSL